MPLGAGLLNGRASCGRIKQKETGEALGGSWKLSIEDAWIQEKSSIVSQRGGWKIYAYGAKLPLRGSVLASAASLTDTGPLVCPLKSDPP